MAQTISKRRTISLRFIFSETAETRDEHGVSWVGGGPMPESDKWSRWLAETRFGGDQKAAEVQMRGLTQGRDLLLKKAGLAEGKIVLDVGAAEGLIGFGAVEKVGPVGRIIFSDISDALLQHTRTVAEQMGS
jgi:hypothetical protein